MRYSLLALGLGIYMILSAGGTVPPATTYPQLSPASSASYSYNWAGYQSSEGEYTSVSGAWIVPEVSPERWGANATWVGIGGVKGDDLIQAGTQAIVGPDGDVSYQAWLELLPAPSVNVPLRVRPGDRVSADIREASPDYWRIVLANETTGRNFETYVAYRSSRSSAEWVEEAPSSMGGSILPLSHFGTTRFLSGSATKNGETFSLADSQLAPEPIHMMSRRGDVLAVTSVIEDGGFSVTRTESRVRTPATTYRVFFLETLPSGGTR